MSLLEVESLETGYERLQVLWGVDLEIAEGESVLLLGANGAGKTTLLRAVVGLLQAWRGRIQLAGTDITGWRPDRRIRAGISYMSELGVFPTMTIKENLRIGGYFLSAAAVRARAEELYQLFPALAERRSELAASLSGGQRKMLGVAKALMSQPKLLVMDEPSAGLAPVYVKEVVEALRKVHGEGMSLLVAEQNTAFLPLADRGYVMEGGRISVSGTEEELRGSQAVQEAYFGL